MPNKKFWKFQNSVESNGSELVLDGPIASETWFGDEVTPALFRDELKAHQGKDLVVSINSPGGDVFAGVSIYNALREFDGEVTVKVSGIAASIASVIAMAGDNIVMSPGSMMMVHKPWTIVIGDTKELSKSIEALESMEDSIIPIYVSRTGLDEARIRELLDAETWMTATEAVELGFADEAIEAKQQSAAMAIQAAFDGKLAFQMAVKEPLADLAAKLEEQSKAEATPEDEAPATPPVEAHAETEIEAEAKDEDPQAPEADPAPATEEQPAEKENDMPNTLSNVETAKDQVITPENQAPVAVKDTAAEMKAYLKSKESMTAFALILEEQAGKTSEDVKMAWSKHLEAKMGVTNPQIFLPEALITEIEDAFKAGGEIWNRVAKTGAEVFRAAWDTEDDVDAEDGRGRGYNRGTEADKAEQVLTFNDRVLRPQFVYKYITLNKEDVKAQRGTGALVRYVLSELPRRIIREVERAIVIGDGRAPGSAYKIDSFVAIKADATANNVFATTYTPTDPTETRYESLVRAMQLIEADGPVVLIAKKGYLGDVLLEKNSNGGFMFAPGTDLKNVFRLEAVIEPDWMNSDADNDAYLAVLPGYKTVGDSSIEAFTNFTLKTNKQEYLQEIWAGGGLTVRKAAVAIPAVSS